jgi:hypothetical protein
MNGYGQKVIASCRSPKVTRAHVGIFLTSSANQISKLKKRLKPRNFWRSSLCSIGIIFWERTFCLAFCTLASEGKQIEGTLHEKLLKMVANPLQ